MKRSLLLSLFAFCAMNLCAQHISFLGIELGQPLPIIDKQLRQKSFYLTWSDKRIGASYKGRFWNYTDANVSARIERGNVTWIMVELPVSKKTPMTIFNNIVSNISKKYGKCQSKYSNKNYYVWKVNGGCINAHYYYSDNSYRIMYCDRTSSIYMKHFYERNYNDDF